MYMLKHLRLQASKIMELTPGSYGYYKSTTVKTYKSHFDADVVDSWIIPRKNKFPVNYYKSVQRANFAYYSKSQKKVHASCELNCRKLTGVNKNNPKTLQYK